MNENMRSDFRREFMDKGVMIFVHGCTKTATPDIYLLNLNFKFFFQVQCPGCMRCNVFHLKLRIAQVREPSVLPS